MENPDLKAWKPDVDWSELAKGYDYIVGGFDIGLRKHPSHLSVFGKKDGRLTQLFQRFYDKMEYPDQVEQLNKISKNFHLDRGYVDNSRGEFNQRGLDERKWRLENFTAKQRNAMAAAFGEFYHASMIDLIDDKRQRSQITCVTTELQAPETVLGHGDAFWSVAMACLAAKEAEQGSMGDVGGAEGFIFDKKEPEWGGLDPFKAEYNNPIKSSCPQCGLPEPAWIPERPLCISCEYRGGPVNKEQRIA